MADIPTQIKIGRCYGGHTSDSLLRQTVEASGDVPLASYVLAAADRIETLDTEKNELLEALREIAKPQYGHQAIAEANPDVNAYNYASRGYFKRQVEAFQSIARAAIAKVEDDTK